jgi:hypothetical protein
LLLLLCDLEGCITDAASPALLVPSKGKEEDSCCWRAVELILAGGAALLPRCCCRALVVCWLLCSTAAG